jgi:carbamoyltransferase
MYVLGISCFYHDSSACLLKDGKVVAAAQLERFTRKKHDLNFPYEAIEYCLKEAGIKISDLDYAVFYEKPLLKFERLLFQFIETFPKSLAAFLDSIPIWLSERLVVADLLGKMGYKKKVFYLEHHLSHAASSFLASPFKKAAILTVDGVGEWATTTLGMGSGNEITVMEEIHFPHSLGLLYSAITAYLGFSVNNSEYKVMGLAPYGKPIFKKEFDELARINDDGSIEMSMKYFSYHLAKKMNSKEMEKLFNNPARKKESEVTQFHKDVAATLQYKTEEALLKMLNRLYLKTKCRNLCIAGGVGLNSVANGKIISNTPFKKIFIQPAAGDAGTSMGAALYFYNSILKKPRKYTLENAFLGPAYSDGYIKNFLEKNKIVYKKYGSTKELIKKTAELIWGNNVVGWFQGRMEWGPRALGARSILSNPCNSKMQDILNLKVKHREKFRPFAPVITVEDAPKWFECDLPIPEPADFMLMVYPIKKEKRKLIPAVTHVDGSGRLQTIRRKQNPLYYDLIKAFEKYSKTPILINTSFNIRGEPIVCSPEDAYRCMMGTGIDYLVMGSFIIKRVENQKDIWDSESLAND